MSPTRKIDDALGPAIEISGLVVHAVPGRGAEVAAVLEGIEGVTVHAVSPAGKLVVTLETADQAESIARYEQIGRLEGVSAVAMAYHRIETEPDLEA